MIPTAVAVMTMFTMTTGCQAKPTEDNDQTTQATIEQITEEQTTTATREINLDEIHATVKEAYGESYVPSAAFDEQGMKELFGVNSDLYDSFIAEDPMIGVYVDTFVAVKTKEDKGEEMAQHPDDYRDPQLNGVIQYPMNLSKIGASQAIHRGDYIFFVMLGTPSEEAKTRSEEAALKSVKGNIQIAIDVIDSYFTS